MDFKEIIATFRDRSANRIENIPKKEYAILLPLVEKKDGLHLVFQVRSSHLKTQPGDVCFPGGKVESTDSSHQMAAIRETSEELGIPSETITDVFPLDFVFDSVAIYPFVGKLSDPEQIQVNPDEVAEIFSVPLTFFLEKPPTIHYVNLAPLPAEDFPFHLIESGKNYKWHDRKLDIPFYHYENKVIWGLTARILQQFIETLKEA